MPVESVAAYINNTITFVMFILVSIIIFLIIFLISAGIRKRVSSRKPKISYRETDEPEGGKSFTGPDPVKKRNSAILGMTFILVFLCVSVPLWLFLYYSYLHIPLSCETMFRVSSFGCRVFPVTRNP